MKIMKIMATSIAFLFASTGITLVLWAVSASGHELVPGHGVDNWLTQGAFTALYAVLAGVLIDTIRWVTTVAWRPAASRGAGHREGRRRSDPCLAD